MISICNWLEHAPVCSCYWVMIVTRGFDRGGRVGKVNNGRVVIIGCDWNTSGDRRIFWWLFLLRGWLGIFDESVQDIDRANTLRRVANNMVMSNKTCSRNSFQTI